MAGPWESRIQQLMRSVSPLAGYSISQVAGMEVYAALATLRSWKGTPPAQVVSMIQILEVIGTELLPELDEEARHGKGTVREAVGRGAVCQ